MSRRLFALDHNFPEPVLSTLGTAIPMAELVPIRTIREGMADLDDWELLVALHRDPRPWDGLITNDDAILSLPKEMTVLSQTALTLVVVKGEGHSPVRATGVLLCHLAHICHHTTHDRAQIWRLRVTQKSYEDAAIYLDKIAEKRKTTVQALVQEHKLAARDLESDV
jgi:hypothetical protein